MAAPLRVWFDVDGRVLRLRLDRPKANIVDAAMVEALDTAFAEHADNPGLTAVILDHEGPNFSFGASIEEHMPDQCAAMLQSLHRLIGRMLDCRVPILSVVRGQCLGGGLEVVSAGGLIFAAPDARFGQPEIRLAVFAPAASCLLPERVGQMRAEDLLMTGRTIAADEGAAMGLVHEVAIDPEKAALRYVEEHLLSLSASSLRFAVTAVRGAMAARVKARLAEVEALYLEGLMQSRDAVEGLNAFLDKRTPRWEHR